MKNFSSGDKFDRVVRDSKKARFNHSHAATPKRVRLWLDNLEDRALMSVVPILPAAQVDSNATLGAGFAPQVIISPLDPLKLVEIHATGTQLAGNFSINGGQTWATVPFPINLPDPSVYSTSAPFVPYAFAESPSVAFDRAGNFYVLSIQHNTANTSGAVVLQKFDFSGGTATHVQINGQDASVLYSWLNQDAAYHPTIAINTNAPTFVDPQTGVIFTDTSADRQYLASATLNQPAGITATDTTMTVSQNSGFPATPFTAFIEGEAVTVTDATTTTWTIVRGPNAVAHLNGAFIGANLSADVGAPKAIYVAWNVNTTQPANSNLPATVSHVVTRVSADSGSTFTTQQPVSVPNPTPGVQTTLNNYNSPLISFTQTAQVTTVGNVGGLSPTDTTINLPGVLPNFRPALPFIIQIGTEQINVTAINAARTSWTVTRGFNGTTAAAHPATTPIVMLGGQLTYLFNAGTTVYRDTTRPDGGNLYAPVAAAQDFKANGGAVLDAVTSANPPTTRNNNALSAGANVIFIPAVPASNLTNFGVGDFVLIDTEQFRITSVTNSTTSLTLLDGAPTAPVAPATDTVTVNPTSAFQVGDLVRIGGIGGEQIRITAITGSTWTILRAQNGTTAAAQAIDSIFTNMTQIRWGVLPAQAGTTAAAHAANTPIILQSTTDISQTTTFIQSITIDAANLTTIKDLNVTLNLIHPHLNEIQIILTPPPASGLQPVTLVRNRTNAAGNTIGNPPVGLPDGNNLGVIEFAGTPIDYNNVGTVFSSEADRRINDATASAPYIGHYRPEAGSLAQFNGRSNVDLSGDWTLTIEDFRSDGTNPRPVQVLRDWTLSFTGIVNTAGMGADTALSFVQPLPPPPPGVPPVVGAGTPLASSITNVYPLVTAASGTPGIGAGLSLAIDNSPGSFSPYQGRMYLAYNGGSGSNTDVYLSSSDDNGATWSIGVRVNDDTPFDNFSEGTRPQFTPTVTVDPTTGTVVVSYYDGRNDPSLARVATTIVTSIDGGRTFSPISYLSPLKTATDFLTGKNVVLEPIPGNQSLAGANGFGESQGLVAYGGKVVPVFASNLNAAGSSIFTASVNIAAGPRILGSEMGAVVSDFTTTWGTTGSFTHNTTFAPDGTRLLDGFTVQFDRPVDVTTFTALDVVANYQDPNTGAITTIPLDALTPVSALDVPTTVAEAFGSRQVGIGTMATTFYIKFAVAQSKVGTYSYAIGSDIRDKIRSLATTTIPVAAVAPYDAPFVSTNVPVNVPDLFTMTSDLILPALPPGQVIGKVTVQINVTHTYDSDIAITLISPNGTRVPLALNRGFDGNDYLDTIFDDNSLIPISTGVAPFTGTFQPETPLAALIGENPQGTWKLEVADSVAADEGDINAWSITVTPGVRGFGFVDSNLMDQNANAIKGEVVFDQYDAPTPIGGIAFTRPYDSKTLPLIIPGPHIVTTSVPNNPFTTDNLVLNGSNSMIDVTFDRDIAAGTFTTANADIRSVIGPLGQINGAVTVTPINSRTFRLTLPTAQTLSGTYSITIGPGAITDLAGNRVDTNLNAGLDVLRGGTDVANAPIVRPIFASTTPVAIPAKGSVVSNISIADAFAITQSTTQLQFSGNQTTFLTGPLAATDTTMFVSSSTGFPPAPFTVQLGTEQIRVDAVNLNTWTVTRAVNNTVAAAYNNGRILTLGTPATIQLALNILHQDIRDLSATLTSPSGQVIPLFTNTGQLGITPRANFANTVLDDSAINPIQAAGTPILGGPFNPQSQFSGPLNGTGSNGVWKLTITNNGKSNTAGTLTNWELRLPKTVPGNGLGEPNADQIQTSFRIFTAATTNAQSTKQWTPVGPASNNSGANSGRIGGLAFDPADPSGNTVFVAGASGGIWKTSDFLTTDVDGPTYVPLTDLGPGFSLNIGSLATFGRSNDPNKTVIFATTGEGDVGSPGVGFLRSMDGGKTWQVLDSSNKNLDAQGNALPMASTLRNHIFVGATSNKVVIDPTPLPNGNLVIYGAFDGTAANRGLWRSIDNGDTWERIRAGNATDVVLAAGSRDDNGNLQRLYASFQGEGVFTTNQAIIADFLTAMPGGGTSTPRVNNATNAPIRAAAPADTPNGANGRIVLATPVLTNNPLADAFYQGWIYAAVATPGGALDGVYLSKDFGLNWTKLQLPQFLQGGTGFAFPTNNDTRADTNPLGFQGNYDITLAIDPNNPNITYLGGSANFNPPPVSGMIRIDATALGDPYALSGFSNEEVDGGLAQTATVGRTDVTTTGYGVVNPNDPLDPNAPVLMAGPRGTTTREYVNLYREPSNPFVNPSTVRYVGVTEFNNFGDGVRWSPFNSALEGTTDQHELIVMRDPLTGGTRLIFGDDQGVFTGVDKGDGTLSTGIGGSGVITGRRNGNLQITQFYYGAAQPSSLAAQLAGALFYGTAQDNGTPISAPDILGTGNLNWTGPLGDATGVATDQTGSGTSYVYHWPCCGAISPTDFFGVTPPGQAEIARTSGLIQTGDTIVPLPGVSTGQWPYLGGSNFAVNPVDSTGLVISSQAGRIFRSAGQALGTGKQWNVIGNPTDLDGTYAPALAFGAQDPLIIGGTPNDFIYAGTSGGRIFVTFAGGGYNGSSAWRNISTGLDGSSVQQIVPNPKNGSHEAYAVTSNGVYWMKDSSAPAPVWVKLNDLNSSTTTLAGAMTLTATTLTVPTGANALFPAAPFIVSVGTELMYVSSITGNTWTVQRGFNNTTKASHTSGDIVTQYNPLFSLTRPVFNNPNDPFPALQYLTSIQADWRYAIPDNTPAVTTTQLGTISKTATSLTVSSSAAFPSAPFNVTIDSERLLVTAVNGNTWTIARGTNGTTATAHTGSVITLVPATHPVLYVGGEGGIYRSRDKGVTWTFYPNVALDGAVQEGGLLPNAHVTDLDLVLGNVNPTTGFNDPSTGYNMLLATTYGRGSFAIRLDNTAIAQYLVAPNSGPKVANAAQIVNGTGTQLSGFTVTYGGEVDPNTFTAADVTVTGPNNLPVPFTVINVLGASPNNQYTISFSSPQTATGTYTLRVGPDVRDLSGNLMDQNGNNINGEAAVAPVGDTFSGTFNFTSNVPPTISAIANQVVTPGGAPVAVQFTIGDTETPVNSLAFNPAPLVVTAPGYTGAAPTVAITGTGATRTLTITPPAAPAHGSSTVTITVLDAGGLQTATTFTVNVDTSPVIPAIGTQTINHGTIPAPIPLNATDPDGDALTFTVSFSDPLFAIKQQYGFTPTSEYTQYFNYYGLGERYLAGASGQLYLLMPDGNLRSGTTAGPVVANVGVAAYKNPDLLLTTTGTPLVSVPNPLYDLQQTYGLTIPAVGYNALAAKEYYLQSSKGLGYFILTSSNTLVTYPDRKFVADFNTPAFGNANVYTTPTLLTSAKLGTTTALTATTAPKPAGAAPGGSITITPHQAFVGTVGVTVTGTGLALSSSQTFNYTVNDVAPTIPTIVPQTTNHTAPLNLVLPITDTDPDAGTRAFSVEFSNPLYDIRTQYGFNNAASAASTQGQKYLYSSNNSNPAGSNYFYILPDNKLYAYSTNAVVEDMSGLGDVYTNPALLTSATPAPLTANVNRGPLYDVRTQYGLNSAPVGFNASNGKFEMYFLSDFGGYFVLVPNTGFTDAVLAPYDGVSAATSVASPKAISVGIDPYFSPTLLYKAEPITVGDPLYALRQKYGFNYADQYYNILGMQEKFLYSATTGAYFFIKPDGVLYQYSTTVPAGIPVTTVGVPTYNNPALLYNATGQAPAVTTTGSAIVGNNLNLTLTPNVAFTGAVKVKVTISDGALSTSQSFVYTVTNAQPTAPTPLPTPLTFGVGSTGTSVSLAPPTFTDNDALTYSVVITDPLVSLQGKYAFTSATPAFSDRDNAKFILSGNGSNLRGSGFFLIKPVAGKYQLIAWDGSAGSGGTVVYDDVGVAVYNNPLLLINATAPAALANVTTNIAGMNLSIAWPNTYTGSFFVDVYAFDGAATVKQSFLVKVA